MARSRSLALCFLITRIFMFLLIYLDSTKAAMGYDLLLCEVLIIIQVSRAFFYKNICSSERISVIAILNEDLLLKLGRLVF
jgi:hypothetical protein